MAGRAVRLKARNVTVVVVAAVLAGLGIYLASLVWTSAGRGEVVGAATDGGDEDNDVVDKDGAGKVKIPRYKWADMFVEAKKRRSTEAPPADPVHDKWIVSQTDRAPTESLRKVAAGQLDWKMAVYAPEGWSLPGCVHMSSQKQKSLDFRLTKVLPRDHFSRKNLAVLYAIRQGARLIYEVDDRTSAAEPLSAAFELPTKDEGPHPMDALVVPAPAMLNAWPYFGVEDMWPLGLPLSRVADEAPTTVSQQKYKVTLTQGLLNGAAPTDAIYALTRVRRGEALRARFEDKPRPVGLPRRVFAPVQDTNLVWDQLALWGMVLPASLPYEQAHVWRGFVTQRLQWDLGHHLAFASPHGARRHAASTADGTPPLEQFRQAQRMYLETEAFVDFLWAWSSTAPHLFDRILDLYAKAVDAGFYTARDFKVVTAWLHDLINIPYKVPKPVVK